MAEFGRFPFVGLERTENGMTATLRMENEEHFKAPVAGMSEDAMEDMWKYCEGNWRQSKMGLIWHNGLRNSGIPIDPVFTGFEYE